MMGSIILAAQTGQLGSTAPKMRAAEGAMPTLQLARGVRARQTPARLQLLTQH